MTRFKLFFALLLAVLGMSAFSASPALAVSPLTYAEAMAAAGEWADVECFNTVGTVHGYRYECVFKGVTCFEPAAGLYTTACYVNLTLVRVYRDTQDSVVKQAEVAVVKDANTGAISVERRTEWAYPATVNMAAADLKAKEQAQGYCSSMGIECLDPGTPSRLTAAGQFPDTGVYKVAVTYRPAAGERQTATATFAIVQSASGSLQQHQISAWSYSAVTYDPQEELC